MGNREQVIHMNRIRPLLEKDTLPTETLNWEPPLFIHTDAPEETNEIPATEEHGLPTERTTRSGRIIRPVDYYGF